MSRCATAGFGWLMVVLMPTTMSAQGWRLRLDANTQVVSYRGWQMDSIPVSAAVTGPSGGPTTSDGYAVACDGGPWCVFFRPGARQQSAPGVVDADATMWGLGVRGLSVHTHARVGGDLVGDGSWPGPDRTFELVEGYADYDHGGWGARLGRQLTHGRLGAYGFDGAMLSVRDRTRTLSAAIYGGWGLGRAADVPVTSGALDPLNDYRPAGRQLFAGGTARISGSTVDLSVEYLRETDAVDYGIAQERVGVSGDIHLHPAPVTLIGDLQYDLAAGLWGSWDIGGRWLARPLTITATIRQYRPIFDLWSIWQAFSPSPYHAVDGAVSWAASRRITVQWNGERYWYPDADVSTPLTSFTDHGWRSTVNVSWVLTDRVTTSAGWNAELGPGAGSQGWNGSVLWKAGPRWSLTARGGSLDRPLEYRDDLSSLGWYGISADLRISDRLRLGATLDRWNEDRTRPDSGGISWDQTRASLSASWTLVSDADRLPLPPGKMP